MHNIQMRRLRLPPIRRSNNVEMIKVAFRIYDVKAFRQTRRRRGERKSKIVLFLPGRWQREISKNEDPYTFGFPATEWIIK